MNRVLLCFLLLASFCVGQEVTGTNMTSVQPAPAAPATPPAVAAGKSPVQIRKGILIGALDNSGSPLEDLNKDQLQIVDSGQGAVPLVVRKASELPLDLAIVLYADPSTFSQQQAAAIDLVKKIIRPNTDHAFIVTAGGGKGWTDLNFKWQTDPDALIKTIQTLDKNSGLQDPFGFSFDRQATGLSRETIEHFGPQEGNESPSAFGVLWAMMKSDSRPVRKAIIIVRDAWPHSPGFSGRYSPLVESFLTDVVSNAQKLGAPIYVIGLEDRNIGAATTNLGVITTGVHPGEAAALRSADDNMEKARRAAYAAGRTNVGRMAETTGGHVWWSEKKNFSDATDSIAKDILGQYVLIFSPSLADVPNPRALRITTTHKDCRLETPTAFYLGPH
jgi:VWFA-related protein